MRSSTHVGFRLPLFTHIPRAFAAFLLPLPPLSPVVSGVGHMPRDVGVVNSCVFDAVDFDDFQAFVVSFAWPNASAVCIVLAVLVTPWLVAALALATLESVFDSLKYKSG